MSTTVSCERQWRHAPTRFIESGTSQFAYRSIGDELSEPPLVLLHRFRGTIDDWDPAASGHARSASSSHRVRQCGSRPLERHGAVNRARHGGRCGLVHPEPRT